MLEPGSSSGCLSGFIYFLFLRKPVTRHLESVSNSLMGAHGKCDLWQKRPQESGSMALPPVYKPSHEKLPRAEAAERAVINTQAVLDQADRLDAGKSLDSNGTDPREMEQGGCGPNHVTCHCNNHYAKSWRGLLFQRRVLSDGWSPGTSLPSQDDWLTLKRRAEVEGRASRGKLLEERREKSGPRLTHFVTALGGGNRTWTTG